MPSPFSLLSESPARRRARRAQKAGQQPPTPVSESPYGTPRDTDVKYTDGSDTLQFPASFADVATSPAVSPAASPDGRAQARRRLQDKSRQHWAGVSSSPSAEQVPPPAPPNNLLAGLSSIFGAAESTTTALQRTLAAGPSEAMVLQALRELPMHRALNTWRNGIEERRERARRFKLASADGVRQWIRQWRLAPSLILWQANIKADQQRDVVLLRMRKITVRVEQRVALQLLKEHALDAVELRDRARRGHASMAPKRRALRKGLRKWSEYIAMAFEFHSRGRASVIAMHVDFKELKEAVAKWVAMVGARQAREAKVSLCLQRTSPEKREMLMGFEALRTRAPAWERGAAHTRICRGGFGLLHVERDRTRDAAIGSPALHKGDLYHFSFAVFGGGSGVVVGVADASYPMASTVEERGGAWGLNLSHGALYVKRPGHEKGELHAQQLIALPAIDRSPEHNLQNLIEIEVEVDLTCEPYRLGFGLPDGPMVHATGAHFGSCTSLRPWAYLWGASDAIVLKPRRRPRAPRMEPWQPSIRMPLSFRVGQSISGLTSTTALRLTMAATYGVVNGPPVRPPSRRHPRAVTREVERAASREQAATVHERSARLTLAAAKAADDRAEALRLQATLGLVPSTDDSPPLLTPPPLAEVEGDASAIKPTPSVTPSTTLTSVDGEVEGGSSAGPVHSSGPVRPVPGAASAGASTARSPVSRRSTGISITGISSTSTATEAAGDASAVTSAAGLSMLALSGEDAKEYTYYDDPRLKRPPEHSPLEAFSLHAMEKRRRALANTKHKIKSYPWDVVRRVTSIYSDVTQQL